MTAVPAARRPPAHPGAVEVDVADLKVDGELPADLDGTYLRIGPDRRVPHMGGFLHPIDGDGMLHQVVLAEGRARYANRLVRTPVPAGPIGRVPNVNVVRHGGKLLALGECGRPYRVGPGLETLGQETFGGHLPAGICAHPKIDPRTGEMLAFCTSRRPPFLTWTVIRPDGTGTPPRPVEGVERPSEIHDMAITDRYVVLVVAPLFLDLATALPGDCLLTWEEADGTQIALIPRDGGPVRWCEDDTFWLWHTVNAHDAKDPVDPVADVVVLDYVQWPRPVGLVPGPDATPRLARAVLDPAAGTVRRETLSDLTVEFPRIDDRLLGRAHPISAFAMRTGRPQQHPGCWDALAWHDTRTGTMSRWEPVDLAVGEPAFAPDPRSDAPGRGWWLTQVTRFDNGDSSLLVIPAADPASGPVAAVRMPVRVPLGLHGSWLPTR